MKRKRLIGILTGVLALGMVIGALVLRFMPEDRLTAQEIAALREVYPLCGKPDLIEMRDVPLEEYIERADTFVYGEIVGEGRYFTKAFGIRDVEFYEYTLTVLDDSEGIYENGTQITFVANALLEDSNPKLRDGMRMVVPVTAEEGVPGRTSFGTQGVFYVTEDGYAITAFDEAQTGTKLDLNGVRVEKLLDAVRKENFQ